MNTAVAIVTADAGGTPVSGVIAYLVLPSGFLFAITNTDGYAVWPSVPVPFSGNLQLAGGAQWYGGPSGQALAIPNGQNITIRVGPTPSNLQDVLLPPCVRFKGGSTLPAPPSRAQLCGVRCSFQGLTVETSRGALPWFEPALGWEAFSADHEDIYDVKYAAGDTHVNIALSSQYDEPNQAYAGIAGKDFSNDLTALRALIMEIICAGASRGLPNGFLVLLAMAGDGMQPDPVGMTYGFDWLMQNFERVWSALRGDTGEGPDLTPWILPMPGYDGVVPGWQPWTCVNEYVRMARAVVGPSAPLAIELAAGYCVWSGEENDWATEDGQMFDVILQEYPYPMQPPNAIPANLLNAQGWKATTTNEQRAPWDQVWQMTGRMVQPYNRPSDQPANDDPGGAPFLLASGTPRGPFFYIKWEFDTYGWVRWCPLAQVQAHRATLTALGGDFVG